MDGNEYVDFHNGYSAMVQGHAHPAIATAVRERVGLGTHFGATTEDAVAVAEELSRRFGLPSWRFTNSGTESNMTAIRIARAATGRDAIVMMKRSYHGHAEFDHVHEVAFNDAAELERCLADVSPACVLMEAAMTSAGLIPPEPGYLKSVRELTRRNGALLIFDEVKTGLTIAAGGAVERFGVEPDLLTLAKSLGGGLPSGAIGMAPEPAGLVAGRQVRQAGTYNGNPLSMAAARASLLQVLTPAAYDELERLGDRMFDGCERVLEAAGIEAQPVGVGSKGCVHWGRSGSDPLRGSDPGARRAHLALARQPRRLHHARPRAGVERDRGPRRRGRGPLPGRLRRPRRRAHSTTVRLCSRMNCGRYQAPRPPFPVDPLDFQPQKVWVPGHAPVVAPARRFT